MLLEEVKKENVIKYNDNLTDSIPITHSTFTIRTWYNAVVKEIQAFVLFLSYLKIVGKGLMATTKSHIYQYSRDRIVVSTSRCGRDNPGSNPGHGSGCAVAVTAW